MTLMAKSRVAPGQILQAVLRKMSSFLSARTDAEVRSGSLNPIVTAYLTSVLQPAMGQQLAGRNRQELRTLAEAVDAILSGNIPRAADILISRFSAVEMAASAKHWNVARHLEIIPQQDVSSVPTELLDMATMAERRDARYSSYRTGSS